MNSYYENFLQSVQLTDNKQIFILKGRGYINWSEEIPKSPKTQKSENLIKLYKEAAKNRYSNLQSLTRIQQPSNQGSQKKQIQDFKNLIFRNNQDKDKKIVNSILEQEKIKTRINPQQQKLDPIKLSQHIQQNSERCDSRVHYYKAKNKVFIIGDKKRPLTTRMDNRQRFSNGKQYQHLFSQHKNKIVEQAKTMDFQSFLIDQGIIL